MSSVSNDRGCSTKSSAQTTHERGEGHHISRGLALAAASSVIALEHGREPRQTLRPRSAPRPGVVRPAVRASRRKRTARQRLETMPRPPCYSAGPRLVQRRVLDPGRAGPGLPAHSRGHDGRSPRLGLRVGLAGSTHAAAERAQEHELQGRGREQRGEPRSDRGVGRSYQLRRKDKGRAGRLEIGGARDARRRTAAPAARPAPRSSRAATCAARRRGPAAPRPRSPRRWN